MGSPQFVPIPFRIIALMQARNRIFAYPWNVWQVRLRQLGSSAHAAGHAAPEQ